jgi:hypothetical protein
MDFATAWKKARSGQKSGLFASEDIYNYPHPQRRHPVRQLTQQQKSYRQATYYPTSSPVVWSEYSNPQNHRYQHSPTLMKAQHDVAMAVFARCEQVLTEAKSGW